MKNGIKILNALHSVPDVGFEMHMSFEKDEAEYIEYLQSLIHELESAVHQFINKIGPPIFINQVGKEFIRA